MILTTLADHTKKIDTLTNKTNNQESRISRLENQTLQTPNITILNYFKYLSSSDRKNIVCGYTEDNHLEHIEDLGWSCDITYRQSRNGKETSSCKCKKI